MKRHRLGELIACHKCGAPMIVTELILRRGDYRCKTCHCKSVCEWAKEKRMRLRKPKPTPIEFFYSRVIKTATCWEWQGMKSSDGYGELKVDGKRHPAHRWIYEYTYGNIGSLNVCHHCDNPLCVRPDHLFAGTQKDNIRDCIKKGRFARGEKNGQARLKDSQILEIRKLKAQGIKSPTIAKLFNIHEGHARKIMSGQKWTALAALEEKP